MVGTNRFATLADIVIYAQYTTELRIDDYILGEKNADAGKAILISTAQGNLISDTAFDAVNHNIWVEPGTLSYLHLHDAGLDGGTPGNLKIRFISQVIIDASLSPTQSNAVHIKGVKNFHIQGETIGFIGHMHGMPEFLQGRYGLYIKNEGATVSRVSLKIDEGNTGWWVSCVEIDGGGYEYSGASTHDKDNPSVRFQDIIFINCYFHDTAGEEMYHGSNVADELQHGYFNVLIINCVLVRGGLEILQIQHGEGKIVIQNCLLICSALNRKNPFQKKQDRNLQFQNIRSGEFIVLNSIFIGGGESIFVCQFFNSYTGEVANRDIIYKNNFFGYSSNYGGFCGNGNGTTGIRFEGNYFKNIGNPFNYDEIYPAEVQKNYTLLFQNSDKVTLKDNFYETANLRSGNATSFLESGNTQGTVADIQFLRCPIKEKAGASYPYHTLQMWNFEIMVDTAGDLSNTNAGDPINYVAGDFVMWRGKLYECILNHTPSDGANTGTFDSAKQPDNDVGLTPVADSNGETIGTYWKLHWFDRNGIWTTFLPDGGYALVTGSAYELLNMGVKSEAQYAAAKPDLIKWRRHLDDGFGSPDMATEAEIIEAETAEYTPPTRAELGIDAHYSCYVTPRDKQGRVGTEVQINDEFILVN